MGTGRGDRDETGRGQGGGTGMGTDTGQNTEPIRCPRDTQGRTCVSPRVPCRHRVPHHRPCPQPHRGDTSARGGPHVPPLHVTHAAVSPAWPPTPGHPCVGSPASSGGDPNSAPRATGTLCPLFHVPPPPAPQTLLSPQSRQAQGTVTTQPGGGKRGPRGSPRVGGP